MEPNPMQDSHSIAASRRRTLPPVCPAYSLQPRAYSRRLPAAFTLTELLIVIAIIAVLAGLIAAAAVNALRAARRNSIVMDIKNLSAAIENFKTDYGAYPPNGMNVSPLNPPPAGSPAALIQSDFARMFKKAFPRHKESPELIRALCGQNIGAPTGQNLENGMTAAEALYFWFGGFSSDEQYPISGPGGPSFATNGPEPGEVMEDRNIRYEFDRGRLGPRTDDGIFDVASGRFLTFSADLNNNGSFTDPGEERQINMWRFMPKGSEQPLLYFDVSRHKPAQLDPPASSTNAIYALKQLREGVTSGTTGLAARQVVFVNPGKFQVLHSGLDDDWGDYTATNIDNVTTTRVEDMLLFPTGPFIGPIADNLSNFTDGTLEDASEE